MAGSKSRSKSPAAAPPSGGDLPIEELLVSAVLVGVAAYAVHAKEGTDVSLPSIKESTLELLDSSSHGFDFNIPHVFDSVGLVFLLHVINQCQGRGRKHFLVDIIEAGLSVNLVVIVTGLLDGGTVADTLLLSNEQYFLVAVFWYILNVKIAGAFNAWESVQDALTGPAGSALQKLLQLSTVLVVTGATIAISKRDNKGTADETDDVPFQLLPLVKAVMVGTATAAIPNGLSGVSTGDGVRALLIGILVSTEGLKQMPFDVDLPVGITDALTPLGMTLNQTILLVTTVLFLFGDRIADLGIPMDLPQQAAGLVNKVLNLPL